MSSPLDEAAAAAAARIERQRQHDEAENAGRQRAEAAAAEAQAWLASVTTAFIGRMQHAGNPGIAPFAYPESHSVLEGRIFKRPTLKEFRQTQGWRLTGDTWDTRWMVHHRAVTVDGLLLAGRNDETSGGIAIAWVKANPSTREGCESWVEFLGEVLARHGVS